MIHTYKSCVDAGILQTPTIPLFRYWELNQDDLYLDFENWWEDIIEPCKYFNCIAYTASPQRLEKCKKLIVSRKVIGELPKKLKVRYAGNMHSKLYIVKNKSLFPSVTVWMGSGNCVSSKGHHNIMMKANNHNAKTLIEYFDTVWEAAYLNRELF